MSDELLLLHDLIHERTGLVLYREDIDAFARRLVEPIKRSGCTSYSDYHRCLLDADTNSEIWSDLIAEFSRSASSFHRHGRHVRILSEILMPRLAVARDRVRIWSAGCSTGEEPLMIAISLSEAGWFEQVPIEIYASDANAHSIEHARRGIYSKQRANTLSPELREKYFTDSGDGWVVDPQLMGRIDWSVANLMSEAEIADKASSDVIFCRNVMIYFSEEVLKSTIRAFQKHMPVGGYLVTDQGDYFEVVMDEFDLFVPEVIEGMMIWKKSV